MMGNNGLTKSYVAAGAIPAHAIVKFGSNDGEVVVGAAAGDLLIGVTTEVAAAGAGSRTDVIHTGIAAVKTAGIIARGAAVTSNNAGLAVAAGPAAGTNARIIGFALATSASGDIIPVLLAPGVMQG
jgi:hypothetical protein